MKLWWFWKLMLEQILHRAVTSRGEWTYTAKNTGNNKVNVTLTVTWRAVGSAV